MKLKGGFIWHKHIYEGEIFIVVDGVSNMHFLDKTAHIGTGELIIVTKGIEHNPLAHNECSIILFENQINVKKAKPKYMN